MKVIEDKPDRFGEYPIWFYSHNLSYINDYLQHHYDGYKFAIVIDCTLGEIVPLEKPLPVYFLGGIAEEVAQEADKKLVDKKEYEGLTKNKFRKSLYMAMMSRIIFSALFVKKLLDRWMTIILGEISIALNVDNE